MKRKSIYILLAIIAIFTIYSIFSHTSDTEYSLKSAAESKPQGLSGVGAQPGTSDDTPMFEAQFNVLPESSNIEESSQLLGAFGQPIGDPWGRFSSNIVAAENGDPSAQFEVGRILFECRNYMSESDLASHVENGVFSREIEDEIRARGLLCRELIQNVPGDFKELSEDWIRKSADSGYPLAVGRQILLSPHEHSADEARDTMLSVVRSKDPEKYFQIVVYLANYRESDVTGYEAWLKLSCDNIPPCNIDEYRGEGNMPLRPSEQLEVSELAAEIQTAIDEQRWADIPL